MPSHSYDVLIRLGPQVPAGMVERAAQWTPDSVPSAAVAAASVILLRDGEAGLETYLLHRHARMPFAPSMVVFPGGRVDPADASTGNDPLRRCALRETFEETGVVLGEAELHPWAHWITPEIEPRRYDTTFFVAALPADQEAADLSGETDRAEWSTPADALAAERSGGIAMLPPTMSILIELADLQTVAAVINHALNRQIEPVLPQLVETRSGWQFRYPQPRPSRDRNVTFSGVSGAPYVRLIRAPNPGPMTLDGTNTWVITDEHEGAVLVDPGPAIQTHIEAILAACTPWLVTIVLTHRHLDHSEAAAMVAAREGCGVRAADPQFRIGPDGLDGGDVLRLGALRLEVFETPGHTSDSRSLLLAGPDGVSRLITGDMVLGRGTTVITYPDGDLAAYFDSLDLLERLVSTRNVVELLPGHGPTVTDPLPWLSFYRSHRHQRLDEIRAALAAGDRTAGEIVARVYADVDRSLWPAAEQSVRAQLDYLHRQG